MVASKCSRNHFISEIYKTVKSFTLHFLQNSPLVQLCTPAIYCEGVGNIPGSQLVCCIVPGPGGERIVDVVPGGTELDLRLRRVVGQAAHTRKNPHAKCTGIYCA